MRALLLDGLLVLVLAAILIVAGTILYAVGAELLLCWRESREGGR